MLQRLMLWRRHGRGEHKTLELEQALVGVRWVGCWKASWFHQHVEGLPVLSPLNHWRKRSMEPSVKNSTYLITKNMHLDMYALRCWIKVIKTLLNVHFKAFIMQFMVLIFLHSVLFFCVVFLCSLSGMGYRQWWYLHMVFWAEGSGCWLPQSSLGPACLPADQVLVSWHGGALLNYSLSPLHTRHVFPASSAYQLFSWISAGLSSLRWRGQSTLLS